MGNRTTKDKFMRAVAATFIFLGSSYIDIQAIPPEPTATLDTPAQRWARDTDGSIWYRDGYDAVQAPMGTAWAKVGTELFSFITVSPTGRVWALGPTATSGNYLVFFRTGITAANPKGDAWLVMTNMAMIKIVLLGEDVWGTSAKGYIYFKPNISPTDTASYGDIHVNVPTYIANTTSYSSTIAAQSIQVIDNTIAVTDPQGMVLLRTGTGPGLQGTGWDTQSKPAEPTTSTGLPWFVDESNYVWFRDGVSASSPLGTSWRYIYGKVRQIVTTSLGSAWAVSTTGAIYFRNGITTEVPFGTAWARISGTLQSIFASADGNIWGINAAGNAYFRTGITASTPKGTDPWLELTGATLSSLSQAADGTISGLGTDGKTYTRTGITTDTPQGTGWIEQVTTPTLAQMTLDAITAALANPTFDEQVAALSAVISNATGQTFDTTVFNSFATALTTVHSTRPLDNQTSLESWLNLLTIAAQSPLLSDAQKAYVTGSMIPEVNTNISALQPPTTTPEPTTPPTTTPPPTTATISATTIVTALSKPTFTARTNALTNIIINKAQRTFSQEAITNFANAVTTVYNTRQKNKKTDLQHLLKLLKATSQSPLLTNLEQTTGFIDINTMITAVQSDLNALTKKLAKKAKPAKKTVKVVKKKVKPVKKTVKVVKKAKPKAT